MVWLTEFGWVEGIKNEGIFVIYKQHIELEISDTMGAQVYTILTVLNNSVQRCSLHKGVVYGKGENKGIDH